MILIVITAEAVGRARLYEFRGRQGRRTSVPVFKAVASNGSAWRFEFAVTRDSSAIVFGNDPPTDRFGVRGECPPSRLFEPYRGRVREDGKVGFSIQLYEPHCDCRETLRGQGTADRKHVLIHYGPGASEGCLMVAGGKRGYSRFKRHLQPILNHNPEIHVTVQERVD